MRALSEPQGGLTSVTITHSTFRYGVPGVEVKGHETFDATTGRSTYMPHVTLQDDTFNEDDFVSPKPDQVHPLPVELRDVNVSLGPNGSVARVTGGDNAVNAIGLSGEEDGSFTWVSPSTGSGSRPLGYATIGTLDVVGPGTVTVPAGGVVKGVGMRLIGASLDATAGGASFVPLQDTSVGPIFCPSTELGAGRVLPAAAALRDPGDLHQPGARPDDASERHAGDHRRDSASRSPGGLCRRALLPGWRVRRRADRRELDPDRHAAEADRRRCDGPRHHHLLGPGRGDERPRRGRVLEHHVSDPRSRSIGCDGQLAGGRNAISVTQAADQSVSITDTTTTRGSISVRSAPREPCSTT